VRVPTTTRVVGATGMRMKWPTRRDGALQRQRRREPR
jgi:hypothetical protein